MAVRKRLYHPEEVRAKIQTSQLVNRLNSFVQGTIELSPHQVTAALGLIRKTMPDLTAVAHSGSIETKRAEELSDDDLADIASRGSTRAAESESGETVDGELH